MPKLNGNVTILDSNYFRTNCQGCRRTQRSGKVELEIYQVESLLKNVITEGKKHAGTLYEFVRMNSED
jgi:hypothetical protein